MLSALVATNPPASNAAGVGVLTGTTAPPTRPSAPWGVPLPSVGNTVREPFVNAQVTQTLLASPWDMMWQDNYVQGMLMLANSKRSIGKDTKWKAAFGHQVPLLTHH